MTASFIFQGSCAVDGRLGPSSHARRWADESAAERIRLPPSVPAIIRAMSDFDLSAFLSLPRVSRLCASRDGRVAVAVSRPNPAGTAYASALWEVAAGREPRRLTRSARGESAGVFAPDGSLLFLSGRPDPDARKEQAEARGEAAALWSLPAAGGEAEVLAAPPEGVDAVAVARDAGTVVFSAATHPRTAGWDEDAEREQARKDAEVTAQLFDRYPIRFWDAWLGPRERHLYALVGGEPVDLAPDAGRRLDQSEFALSPDGRTVVAAWWTAEADPKQRWSELVAIDVASRERRVLAAGRHEYTAPAVSPDGRWVATSRMVLGDPQTPHRVEVLLVGLDGGGERVLGAELDLWPAAPVWTPDSAAVLCTADRQGHTVPVRLDLDGGADLLATEGTYSSPAVTDEGVVYALRSSVAEAERVVRFTPGGPVEVLPTPGDDVVAPGRVERVVVPADDGVDIGSWLVLPPGASEEDPAPLVVFIHGGPLGSWSGWHWRWNPHVLAARGYAVLLPDPALSTGYGQDFIARGWGRWGAEPYTDVMAAVDGAVARADVDADRTAAMGGSFGGYLANWVAGNTDRFDAIVTHASLWDLEGFHGTTDLGVWWEFEFGDPYEDPARYREHSPRRHVGDITTPMLVIHGELDYRVPVSEALTLWTDLQRHRVPSELLYFPDENHWVLKPQNARLWYATVLAFLDHHVLGAPWERPDLL
jgi:dipeptidyl aminopeptidase/acylaminoacyl peptidase